MTSEGSTQERFQRALQRRNRFHDEVAARELRALNLADALKLTILAAEAGDKRWPKMAARWPSRFVDEPRDPPQTESAFVAAAAGPVLGGPSPSRRPGPCASLAKHGRA
jgi:hypothetical protein